MPGAPRTNPAAVGGGQADLAARLRLGAENLHDRLSLQDTFIQVIRSVNQTLEPGKVADALLDHAQMWFPAACHAVAILEDAEGVSLLAERGPSEPFGNHLLTVGRWVIDNDRPLMTANIQTDRRVSEQGEATVVAFPLRARKRPIGALIALDPVVSDQNPALPRALEDLLETLLEVPALALDTAVQLRRFEALSVTDDLTGLYNSRYLNQVLRRESKRAIRSARPVSMLFLDLDGFKNVNDRHGHLSGSRALVEAAEVIQRCSRETDIVARFGGDEFAVILPDTNPDGAMAMAERVRERISLHPFLASEGLTIRLTASIGVATLPDMAGSAEELIRVSDAAMYGVKDTGKNGVKLASQLPGKEST
jgi:diguanylate cyclase (GGDEF)-like protein